MIRPLVFTSLGLALGSMCYGHHVAVWVLLTGLFSAGMLIPDEHGADRTRSGRLAAPEAGGEVSDRARQEHLLEMFVH